MKKHDVTSSGWKYTNNRRNKVNIYDFSIRKIFILCVTTFALVSDGISVYAQDGIAGIQEASNKVRSYFAVGTSLMYAIGAILGLIGAIKVYQKWSNGHQDTGSVAAAWFGSCVFLVIVATVLKSFFGV